MAVYTEVADDEIEAFLQGYDLGSLVSLKGIAEGVENSNYLMRTDGGTFILTLYEKRVNEADLPFFLGLMEHLATKGITCPQPVKARDGSALGRLAGRPATIVTFLDGMWVRKPNVGHCAAVGEALARLHEAGRDFAIPRPNALGVEGWRPLFAGSRDRADEVLPGLRAEIEGELDHLERHWPRDLPTGVIHADLFNDNVFFLRDRLSGVIDFYFACNDALAYDLAICLNAWCFEPDYSFNVTKARAMITGYLKGRSVSAAEIEALPLLARGAALRFLLTRLYDWLSTPPGALVKKKDPLEYLKKMRFHRGVQSAKAYGFIVEDFSI
jgi:homoserine kinase type II